MVRSLGRAGYHPVVVSARAHSLAGASRWSAASHQAPDPLTAADDFVARVREIVAAERIALVLPIAEPAVLALLGARESLGGATIPFPPLARFLQASDKASLLATASGLGIAVPAQTTVGSPADLERAVRETTVFPVVLKPCRSVAGSGVARIQLSVRHAAGAAELAARLGEYSAAAFPILVQQRVVGPGVGIFLLLWDGRQVAQFAHRRLREKPPSGGVSVYRESIIADPALVARSRALLDLLGWKGVAMIEYKVDAATGTPYLMEINGRYWGSLQLAVDAGVDFPTLLVRCALGEAPAPIADYRVGVRSRWWWGDVDQLVARLRRSDRALALPPDAPGRLRAVGQFLRLWWPGDHNEILRWDDPMPCVRETLDWFRGR